MFFDAVGQLKNKFLHALNVSGVKFFDACTLLAHRMLQFQIKSEKMPERGDLQSITGG